MAVPAANAGTWWDCGWVYRSEVAVSATGVASNYPVQVKLQSADFHPAYTFSANGHDIRVIDADDSTPLSFFVDEWNVPERSAIISVNVPQLSQTPNSLYIYYGDAPGSSVWQQPASASNADTTFVESGWRMHTRFTNLDPTNEAQARSLFNGIDDTAGGYGCAVIDTLIGRNNRNTFNGPNGNYGLLTEVYFNVDIPGVWEFRMGSDFGRGCGLFVDGQSLDERWNEDLWWANNYNHPDVLTGSIHLENGFHHLEALGYEGCCDGTINVQYKTPGSGTWLDMDTTNLSLYGRSCPPGLTDNSLIATASPSYYQGSVFYDNGSGGTAHDGIRHSAEDGVASVDVTVTVLATGSGLTDQTDTDGNWSVCFLDDAVGSDINIVASLPAGVQPVSEGSPVVNTDAEVNGALTLNIATDADYTDNNIGVVKIPELRPDRVLSLVAGTSKSMTHTYTATTTADLSFQISTASQFPAAAFDYVAHRDTNCDGIVEQPPFVLSNPMSVVAGDTVCIVISVTAGSEVDANSNLTLQVDANTRISDLDLNLQSTRFDEISGLPVGELVLEKHVCNISNSSCDVLLENDFSYYNAGMPGDRLVYRVTFQTVDNSVSEVTITDSIPSYTSLEPLSISMHKAPAGVSCNLTSPVDQSVSEYRGEIEWSCIGTVNALDSGEFSFTVVVD